MKNSLTLAQLKASDGATPEVLRTLISETDRMITSGTQRYSRYGLMFDTRYALWDGQNDEGTKEMEDAFPWPGASDTRVRLADKIIKERKRLRKAAFWGKRIKAKAIRSDFTGAAGIVNSLMKWMLYTQALPMVKRELELAWSYEDTYGACVMGCFWRRRTRLEPQIFDGKAMANLAQQQEDRGLAAALMAFMDPLRDPETTVALQRLYPEVSDSEIRVFLRRFRKSGRAELRTAYLCENQPEWAAGRPGIDVFFDGAADDLQIAPLVVWRELLTEHDVREREKSESWSPEFIEKAMNQAGKTGLDSALDPLRMSPRGGGRRSVMAEDLDQRVEILRAFYFVHERGTSALYQTVFHRHVPDVAALHILQGYEHNKMPFHAWRCETEERPILESRGIPELCLTWQTEKKTYRDAHTDRISLEVLPTLMVPRGHAGEVLLGPAQQIERKRAGDYEFLTPPPVSRAAEISNEELEREICEYFGRFHPQADPVMVNAARQELVTDALTDIIPVAQQTWALAQQFLTDEEIQAVAGPLAEGLRVGRKEIQGQFHFEFTFDVRTLDTEFIDTVISAVKEILPMDRMGVIDLSGLVGFLFECIDPNLAERFVRPAQQAAMAEVDDELNQLARAALGIESPMRPAGNPELRLQVLQQVMQSPRFRELVADDQTGTAQKLLENQQQKYQFQITQFVDNAQIGRMGVKPVMGGAGDGLPLPGGVGLGGQG